MRDDIHGRGEGRPLPRRRGPLGRLVMGIVLVAILTAGGATAYYLYMRSRGQDPLGEAVSGLDGLADKLKGGRGEGAGKKLRDLGRFLKQHDGDIDGYADEVDEKLSKIREVSEEAYQKARRKIDDLREKKAGEERGEK